MYKITQELKKILRKPLGIVLNESELWKLNMYGKKIAVGDKTSLIFIKHGILPDVYIYDGKIMRKKISKKEKNILDSMLVKTIKIKNPPGMIQEDAWIAIEEAKKEKTKIFVEGEEDLLVLPAVILLEGTVYYGQPNKGVVAIHINKETKKVAKKILEQMKVVL